MMRTKRAKGRRRRSNPVPVLVANPFKRHGHHPKKRRRKRRSNPGKQLQLAGLSGPPAKRRKRSTRSKLVTIRAGSLYRRAGRKIRKLGTKVYRRDPRKGLKRLRRVYTRRRSNPFAMNALGLLRIGFFGALGIVTARVGKNLYMMYIAEHVRGDGSSSARGMLSDVLQVVTMGAITLGIDAGLRKVPFVRTTDSMAFKFGGLAEAGRSAVAAVAKRVRPTANLARYGLDGMGALEPADSFEGLEPASAFMGELEDVTSFEGGAGSYPFSQVMQG